MNNNLLKFSGHKVIGSSSSEKESECSSSSLDIEYEKMFKDEFRELVQKAENKKEDNQKLVISSKNLEMI